MFVLPKMGPRFVIVVLLKQKGWFVSHGWACDHICTVTSEDFSDLHIETLLYTRAVHIHLAEKIKKFHKYSCTHHQWCQSLNHQAMHYKLHPNWRTSSSVVCQVIKNYSMDEVVID